MTYMYVHKRTIIKQLYTYKHNYAHAVTNETRNLLGVIVLLKFVSVIFLLLRLWVDCLIGGGGAIVAVGGATSGVV